MSKEKFTIDLETEMGSTIDFENIYTDQLITGNPSSGKSLFDWVSIERRVRKEKRNRIINKMLDDEDSN